MLGSEALKYVRLMGAKFTIKSHTSLDVYPNITKVITS